MVGDACKNTDGPACAPGAICPADAVSTSTCEPTPADGSPCTASVQCDETNSVCAAGTCQPLAPNGATCPFGPGEGIGCEAGACSPDDHCVTNAFDTLGAPGAACVTSDAITGCLIGYCPNFDSNGTCPPAREDGESCGVGPAGDCLPYSKCKNGICVRE